MNSLKVNLLYKTTLVLTAMLVMVSSDLQAQHRRDRQIIRAYPAIGATASQIEGDELKGFRKWGFTAGVGAIVSLSSNELWHLSLEADFSQRGAFNNTNNPYSLIDFTMNYVDIPLSIHFTDPYGGMTFGAGLVYSRLVQQPHGLIFYAPDDLVPDSSDFSFLRNDLAVAIDIRFPIWKGFTMNIRYQYSLIPVKKNLRFTQYHSSDPTDYDTWTNDCYNSSIMIRLMYVFGSENNKTHRRWKK